METFLSSYSQSQWRTGLQGHYLGAENLEGFVTWEAVFGLFLEGLYNCNRQREGGLFQVNKTFRQVCSGNTYNGYWGMAQLAECLPSMQEALGLAPSAT